MPAARALSPLPALPIALPPIGPQIPSIDAIFHPCVVVQRTSSDLVHYTRDLGRIVTVG